MVDHIKAQLAAHGIAPKKPAHAAPVPRKAAPAPTEPQTPRTAGKSKEKEPAEKHASLPPPPEQPGPWLVGRWGIRQTTTYAPVSRVVLTGPADEFEQLLAHLKLFKP